MLGIFDSGFGGLSVLRSIHARLPDVSTVYLGDNARAPYGTRSHEEIFRFTLEGVRELFSRGCPLVILACNTASAQALRQIQRTILPSEFPDRRVIGVIRPTAEKIVELTQSGHLGVMATPATVNSCAYLREIEAASGAAPIHVTQIACPGLVELIEAGHERSPEMRELVELYVADLLKHDNAIDTVLLGCTHYPLIADVVASCVPPNVRVVSQGEIVSDKLADYLARHAEMNARIDNGGTRTYLTTKHDERLSALASRFYGAPVRFERIPS
ncbi:glutamate racemase [bacterium]|nr:glutamate racemase [bacterium]